MLQWIVIVLTISVTLYKQSFISCPIKHNDFVEGHFCGEISNNFWFETCPKLLIADMVEKLKTTDLGTSCKAHSFSTIFQLLVLLSGDVHLHPGPVKYPCAICSRPVACNHRALQCDRCDFWCHIKCVGVPPAQYNQLIGSSTSWECPPCGTVQHSDSFFSNTDSNLDLSNSFSALSDDEDTLPTDSINESSVNPPRSRIRRPKLKILSINANSLVSDNRHALLSDLLNEHDPDILCVCESKLDSTISDSAVLPQDSGYEIVSRKDNKLGAGGVLIAVKNTLVASPLTDLETDCELVWARIEIYNSKPLYVGSFYRTPSKDDPEVINQLHESVSKLTCRDTALPNIILNGDFNTPDILWENASIRPNNNYSIQLNNTMLDFVSANYLTQLTDKPTRNDNILDLTLTTNPDIISNLEIHPGMSDHCAVSCEVDLSIKRQKKPDRYVYRYKKGNIDGVKNDMKEFSNAFLNEDPYSRTVDDNWNRFKTSLKQSMDRHIPQKKITSRWNLPWITTDIKRLCRRKKRAWDAGKRNHNSHAWKRYLKLNHQVKVSLEKAHRDYIDNILNVNITENPKKVYSYIKQKKSGESSIPVLKPDNIIISDSTEKAEALNAQYTSQFTREPDDDLPEVDGDSFPPMPDILFTTPGVEKLLNNLNPSKASGPDLLPTRILKMVSMEIAPVLCMIYQQSYNTGQVPLDWQQANVTAVYKKGDKTNPANYRPVSLTCILCKTMEHIIFSQTMGHLDNYDILVHFQHGFRPNHSCETQLLNTVEDLAHRLDKRKTTDLLILDFSKAFDTVPHRRLLLKLKHYGIDGKTNRWIASWLCHRQQKVVLDGASSTHSQVLSGVPQGTVLGPLLFLIYVNDIGDKISPQTTIKLFADDALLYRTINNSSDGTQLQHDLDTMIEWSKTWLMRFNAKKCHLLKVTRKQNPLQTRYIIDNNILEEVQHHPYLGVELTSNLTWKTHIANISGRANRILNLLRRHLYGCSQEVKSRAFTTLVRPHLEYSSTVWDPYYKEGKKALEKIQRKGARFVTGNYSYQHSVTSMLDDLNWPPLEKRRKIKRLTTFYKICNNSSSVTLPDYVKPSISRTRSHDRSYIQIQTNYEQYKNSFIPRTIREWNSLPPDLVHAESVDVFTTRLQTLTA